MHHMAQFQVVKTRISTYLVLIDNSYYDYVWGFYKPIKTLTGYKKPV